MAQELSLKIAGLYTYPSDLSEVPDGSLSVARNIAISKPSIAELRRGFDYLTYDNGDEQSRFSDETYRAQSLFFYQDQTLAHYGTVFLAYNNASTGWDNYAGSIYAPTGVKMRSVEANQNLYLTSNNGVQKLDAYTSELVQAGAPPALDLRCAISASSATWLPDDYRVSYRLLWGYRDANNNLILGAPSQIASITNTSGGAAAIDVTATIPNGITTAWFYQLYRSASVDNSGGVVEPNDELGLVYEDNPTSGQLSAGTVTITDITPDALRGATIYTAPSQQGLAASNYEPPMAKDVAVYRNTMFYLNVQSKQQYNLTLLGVGSPDGLQINDTITIDGVVYTGKAAEDIAAREFQVVSSGSAAQNIRDTSQSLVHVINRSSSSTVYAYYISGVNDLPGRMLFQARRFDGAQFPVISSRATCWNPRLPSSGTAQSSTNDVEKNGLYYSKDSQPEAVPLPNRMKVGSANQDGDRILALRESLFVLKNDGVFRVTGYASTGFQVELLDNTANIVAPESAVVLNNQIFCFTTQGIATISETGVSIVSRPIETDLLAILARNPSGVRTMAFGVAYETERTYTLYTVASETDTYPTVYFQYNIFTNTWVSGTLAKTCGGVNPAVNKLYLGNATAPIVDVERKDLQFSDYVDYLSTETIGAVDGQVVTISGSDTISVGDVLYQSLTVFGIVESVDPVAGTVTTSLAVNFALGDVDVLAGISAELAWNVKDMQNPGIAHQFREVALLFKTEFAGEGQVYFSSEVNPTTIEEDVTGGRAGGWGLFAWGGPLETVLGVPWGGDPRRQPFRVSVPRVHQRTPLLTVGFRNRYGYSNWQLQGISLIGRDLSERIAK